MAMETSLSVTLTFVVVSALIMRGSKRLRIFFASPMSSNTARSPPTTRGVRSMASMVSAKGATRRPNETRRNRSLNMDPSAARAPKIARGP